MSNPHFTFVVEMKGAAFDEDPGYEIRRLLRKTADLVGDDTVQIGDGGNLLDTNGNTVGRWQVTNGDFAEGPS